MEPQVEERTLEKSLLDGIDEIAGLLRSTRAESEELRHLSPVALEALEDAGLYRINVPVECGGLELDPVGQMRVIARLAEIDSASAWNVMVSNNSASYIAAYLPDPGFSEAFADGVPRAAGVGPAYGVAVPSEDGYRISGRFRLCSGADHAQWFRFTTWTGEGADRTKLFFVVPRSEVIVLDNWDVLGMRGSGSPDVLLEDAFVPERMTLRTEVPLRGGGHFRFLDLPATAYEHAAVAIGLGRRAVAETTRILASRPTRFDTALNALGKAHVRIETAATAVEAQFTKIFEQVQDPTLDPAVLGRNNMVLAAYATDVALECVETAYRLAGAAGLYSPNEFEQLLRDVHGVSQHVCVQDFHYTSAGRYLLEDADVSDR